MSVDFCEARAADGATTIEIMQGDGSTKRRIRIVGPDGYLLDFTGRNKFVLWDDFLADIIVRGIRSLEEERAIRVAPPLRERIVLDEDTPDDPDWGWPGHGAG